MAMSEIKISFGPQQQYTLQVPVPEADRERMLTELLKNIQTLVDEMPRACGASCAAQKMLPFYQ